MSMQAHERWQEETSYCHLHHQQQQKSNLAKACCAWKANKGTGGGKNGIASARRAICYPIHISTISPFRASKAPRLSANWHQIRVAMVLHWAIPVLCFHMKNFNPTKRTTNCYTKWSMTTMKFKSVWHHVHLHTLTKSRLYHFFVQSLQ